MRVLVADDEQDMARALEAMLKSDGYEVDTVYDGQAALDFGETGTYDCIVLDIMMPYRDGLDVVRTLRSKSLRTPILILTAKSAQEDVVGGLNSGADDYLTKPFSMVELLARVRASAAAATPTCPAYSPQETSSSTALPLPYRAEHPRRIWLIKNSKC